MSRLFDLTGRTALVTGSARGIGFALARGLAAAGARVVLNGRDEAHLPEAAALLDGAAVAAFDVTDHAAAAEAALRSSATSARSTSWSTTPACSIAPRSRTSRRPTGRG